jgi:hypothetical protein
MTTAGPACEASAGSATSNPLGWQMDYRSEFVRVVRGEIGPLRPARVAEYWDQILEKPWYGPHPPHWCGALCLWGLQQVGLALGVKWKIPTKTNPESGFLLVQHDAGRLPVVISPVTPEPGDIAYFNEPYRHHAIVVEVRRGEKGAPTHYVTVDGNQPDCRETVRTWRKGVVFYSIDPFIRYARFPREYQ